MIAASAAPGVERDDEHVIALPLVAAGAPIAWQVEDFDLLRDVGKLAAP